MSILRIADSFYIGVRDVSGTCSWYVEKLGLKKVSVELDEGEGCVGLAFPKEIPTPIVVGPARASTDKTTRMFYTSSIDAARKWLNSRGIEVSTIETDRQGTQYFSMRDLEGNAIEVSEEP